MNALLPLVKPHVPASRSLDAAGAAALAQLRSPAVPAGVPFALLRAPSLKPVAFASLAHLARRIHADRAGRPIQCVGPVVVGWRDGTTRRMVAVYTLGPDGQRDQQLGFAWLGGGEVDRERLQAALAELAPPQLDAGAA